VRTGLRTHGHEGDLWRRPRSTGGQEAVTGRPGGGWAARPSAARSRRTAWGSVTAPTIRRGPASGVRRGPRSRTRGGGAWPRAVDPTPAEARGQPAGRVLGPPLRSPGAIRQGLADWPETVETNYAARTCPRSGTVNLKRCWLQGDSNPCLSCDHVFAQFPDGLDVVTPGNGHGTQTSMATARRGGAGGQRRALRTPIPGATGASR
jgi:hypothetical protein